MNNIKNLKVRLLSILTALTLAGTPVMGRTEEDKTTDKKESSGFTLVRKRKSPVLTFEDYVMGVKEAYDEAIRHGFNFGETEEDRENFQHDIQCLYYLFNRSYMPKDVEEDLLDNGIVYETVINDLEERLNFDSAERLIKAWYEHDSQKLKVGAKKEDIIDLSKFCFNENDKDIVNKMIELLVKSYENGKFNEASFDELFKTLTTLNTEEKKYNADALSVGPRCLTRRAIGELAMLVLRYDLIDNYEKELDKYYQKIDFRKEVLNRDKWVLRDDVDFDYECMSKLENEIYRHGQLTKFCDDDVYIDLMTSFVNFDYGKRTYSSVENATMTLDEFESGVKENYDEIIKHLNYGNTKESENKLEQAICCQYYLANVDFISEELEDELKNRGLIYTTEDNKVDVVKNTTVSLELIDLCRDLIQSKIKYTDNVEDIVDLSKFCYNKNEAAKIKEILVHLVKSYSVDKNNEGIFNKEEFQKFYDSVMDINASNTSIGANYLNSVLVGQNGMQVLGFYFTDYYLAKNNKDIYNYFQKTERNRAQWFLREDVNLESIPEDDELAKYVKYFSNLWDKCYTNAINEMFEYLNTNVNANTKKK